MSQKRQPDEDQKIGGGGGGGGGNSPPEEKRPRLQRVIQEAWRMHSFQKFLSSLEPLVRRVVKEEVEEALRKYLPSMKQNDGYQGFPSASQSLQLKFNKKLSLPVFTGARIEGEEGSSVEVILVDGLNGEIISSCPESSAKVELVVLEGDFEGDGEDNWTLEEFESNIVKEREGKRPLLNGELSFNLNEGTGVVSELVFTDNSSWTRSRKFKLGARVVDDRLDRVRVREAKTEAFMVKDHRGELYKKHYPPSLLDDVWRLEKIGKDGAFHKRLSRENINTVKDFLTLLWLDAPSLRNILGPGMSTKMWEVAADHARTCVLDNQKYLYSPPGAQQGTGVVFNIVGRALGLRTEQQFVSIDELSGTEKDDANRLIKVAIEHWGQLVPYDDMGTLGGSLNLPTVSIPASSTAVESSCVSTFSSFLKPGEFGCDVQPTVSIPASSTAVESSCVGTFPSFLKPGEFGVDTQPNVSSSDIVSSILSMGGTRSLDNYNWQGLENMDLRYEQPSSFPTQMANSIICDVESMARSFCSEDPLQYFNPETPLQSQSVGSESQSDLGTAVSSFLAMSARTAAAAAIDKAQTRWTVLVSLLRWRFSIKRIVASKKSGGREMTRYGKRVIFN